MIECTRKQIMKRKKKSSRDQIKLILSRIYILITKFKKKQIYKQKDRKDRKKNLNEMLREWIENASWKCQLIVYNNIKKKQY